MKNKYVIGLFYIVLVILPFTLPTTSCGDGCDVFADIDDCVTDCGDKLGWMANGCPDICCMKFSVSGIGNACRFESTINLLRSNGNYIHSDRNPTTQANEPKPLTDQGGGVWLRSITLNECFDEDTNSETLFNEIFSNPGTFVNFILCEEYTSGCSYPNNYAAYSILPTVTELETMSIDQSTGCVTIYMDGTQKNLMMKCINCCNNN